MIIKGKSRAAPNELANHLGRADTNERIEILQLDSAGTTAEAFRDWQTYTLATKGKLGLYHANIDPDAKYEMTPQQWMRAVDILEEELGLQGQPRAVVMHEKHGRQHIHVVWARTDMETMRLRSDSQNYQAHERASLRMEQEFGHELVPGKHAKRDREQQPEFPRAEATHDEWQQAERQNPEVGGIGHRDRKAQVTALYEASDTGAAFKAALEDAGYTLARGDRRDFVILDGDARVHSLGRQLPGLKAKELRAFMSEIDPDSLPSVKEARTAIRANTSDELKPEQATDEQIAEVHRIGALRQAIEERHREELNQQELRHASEVTDLQQSQQEAADKAIADFAKEWTERMARERPEEPGRFERLWRDIRETLDEGARRQRIADEANAEQGIEKHRDDQIRIMIAGLDYTQRAEIDELVDRQARERTDLFAEQARDLKRRLADEERAIALEREYEQRRQEALSRERDGPGYDPRAR